MGDLDNDMDELFRKAANHYPLKTDGADWNKVMGKLPDAVSTPLPIIEQKNKSNRKLLWLILLFPMGWLCNSYFNGKNDTTKNNAILTSNISSNKSVNDTQFTDKQQNKIKYRSIKKDTVRNNSNIVKVISADNNQISFSAKNENISNQSSSLAGRNTSFFVKSNKVTTTENELVSGDNNPIKLLNEGNLHNQTLLNNGDVSINNAKSIKENTSKQSLPENKTQQVDSLQKQFNALKIDSFQTKKTDTAKAIAEKAKPQINEKNKGFYLSAIGGLDASSVKSQGIKKAGYSYGLLIGYNLNKDIAMETGILFDRKQYYTDGEYFNKTRTMIPNSVAISDMNGSCYMFELPIDVRYNFRQNKKTLFFGTVGLSSYFMKKENYSYEATANGSSWYAMKTYNNSGNNLFSLVDLGIGYEHKIGKKVSLRINPYLKIPLKGLGIGSLPITSSGVNIGITIPFHK